MTTIVNLGYEIVDLDYQTIRRRNAEGGLDQPRLYFIVHRLNHKINNSYWIKT